ncbi:hypothetical protein QBC33DRAFT_620831 [Phialemonium atrogriseum]|uniref:Amidohydrolase-related domain-containing protein n=1 Tax=Phialemonium atrogriseum TaxID=1093897 RepID=A0AAJ0BX57_9PEZI|nr:uncharacterized protein QBC33DRAFT_620831 [Phialemonium atrogriseum]KAK1765916.1 hypothetical protein QBC33DRAFT_620831 [Phialemonium atrogriseum]
MPGTQDSKESNQLYSLEMREVFFETAGMEAKSKPEADRYIPQIADITGERIKLSDAHGIGYTIVSLTVPGIQGPGRPRRRREAGHRDRLGAFASLLHLLGLVSNGVFDRFPTLKVIVGHLVEHVPFDFWRINCWFEDIEKPLTTEQGGVMCEKTIDDSFKRNIGYVMDAISADGVLFSVDYLYETIDRCSAWWDGEAEQIQKVVGWKYVHRAIGRDNAKALFKLKDYHNADAPV